MTEMIAERIIERKDLKIQKKRRRMSERRKGSQ